MSIFFTNIVFIQTLILITLTQSLLFCTKNKIHISGLQKLFDNFHSVQPGTVYRSAQLKPSSLKKYIQRYGIKTVINLRGINEKEKWWQKEKEAVESLGANYYSIPFRAVIFSSKENLQQLLYLYKHAPKPILIHCRGGIDRTGEAAALWILEHQRKSKKEALKHLSLKYGYLKFAHPAKYLLIKLWENENWLNQNYNPSKLHQQYKINFNKC